MLLHVDGNVVNIYIAHSNTGRSTIQRVHNAEFPWQQNMLLHVHGNAVNIYIADSKTGRSTIQRVNNAEFPW